MVVTSIRVDRGTLDRFRVVADANQRSVSGELRFIIDRHIAQAEKAAQRRAA